MQHSEQGHREALLGDGTLDPATQLFTRFRETGDREDVERALLLCVPALRNAAARASRTQDVADLVQDCFVTAIRRSDSFDCRQRLLPWLLGILQNVARKRHHRRWSRLSQNAAEDTAECAAVAAGDSASEMVAREDLLALVVARIAHLPAHYRAILHSHLIDGEPLVAIAARTGRSPSTVRTHYARGLQELRRRLPAPAAVALAALLAPRAAAASSATLGGLAWNRYSVLATGLAACLVAMLASGQLSPRAEHSERVASAVAIATSAIDDGPVPSPGGDTAAARDSAAPDNRVCVTLQLESGQPAVGLPVVLDPQTVNNELPIRRLNRWRTAVTDHTGTVEFLDVPPGPAKVLLDEGLLLFFQMGTTRRQVSGKVRAVSHRSVYVVDEEGRPVGGARVYVARELQPPGFEAGVTDENGRVRIGSALPEYYVWVRADGYYAQGVCKIDGGVAEANPPFGLLQIDLKRCSSAGTGRVLAADGTPCADALVMVWSHEQPTVPLHTATDASGHFRINELPPGAWSAAAHKTGWAPACREGIPEGQEASVRLAASGSVTVNPVGPPGSFKDLYLLSLPSGQSRNLLGKNSAHLDSDGTFKLHNVHPGKHIIYLVGGPKSGIQRTPLTMKEVDVAPDASTQTEIRLPALWSVTVVNARGLPLSGCNVRMQGTDWWSDPDKEPSSTTSESGTVTFLAPQGRRRLSIHLPVGGGHYGAIPSLVLDDVRTDEPLKVTVPEELMSHARLRGQVPGNLVVGRWRGFRLRRGAYIRTFAVGDSGEFDLPDLPAGTYTLQLGDHRYGQPYDIRVATVVLQPGQQLDLGDLPDLPIEEVAVDLPADGAIGSVACELRNEDGVVAKFSLEPGKRCTVLQPHGQYSLTYTNSDGTEVQHPVSVSGPIVTSLPRFAGNACKVEIRGFPLRAGPVRVTLRPAGLPGSSEHLVTWGAQQDRAVLALDLQPGLYECSVETSWGSTVAGTICVTQGRDEQTFSLSLP